jgi:hypothetical protein
MEVPLVVAPLLLENKLATYILNSVCALVWYHGRWLFWRLPISISYLKIIYIYIYTLFEDIYIYSIKECYFYCSSASLILLLVSAISEPWPHAGCHLELVKCRSERRRMMTSFLLVIHVTPLITISKVQLSSESAIKYNEALIPKLSFSWFRE